MKKQIICTIIFILCMQLLIISHVDATDNAINSTIKNYEIETPETILFTQKEDNLGGLRTTPAQTYDFIDENNRYNLVYASEKNVYWSKFDNDMKQIEKTIVIPMFYNNDNVPIKYEGLVLNFGNAIYDNGYLYIVYGRYANSHTENVMAVVKYNQNGEVVKQSEIKACDLTSTYSGSDGAYDTQLPFWSGECDLTIKDGVIAGLMARHIFGGHETSLMFFIDAETLNWLSNMKDSTQYNITYVDMVQKFAYSSHSFGQRIINTSNGDYVLMEVVDASPRGMALTKFTKHYDAANRMYQFNKTRFVPFHFREGGDSEYGYNNVYAVMGNLLEVSDGYLYIGASEKTLSLAYGNSYNESYNVFAQKYKKDLENYNQETRENMAMLEAPVRTSTGTKATQSTRKIIFN